MTRETDQGGRTERRGEGDRKRGNDVWEGVGQGHSLDRWRPLRTSHYIECDVHSSLDK